ncbi:MAG: hypothetical protein LLG04_09725 [Parachlamydia sp.]|nr:hypothetical protein [Parachlamydia sp.]
MGFEDTYKASYSHGLESIYAIETVDLRSVRRFSRRDEKVQSIPKVLSLAPAAHPQFQFDFGPGFTDWMEPFLLEEPVQVLGLSRHAEKLLLDQKRLKLRDLSQMVAAIGQGHRDEINQKLAEYIHGKERERSYQIDFGSWMRSLCPCEQRKQCHLLLESFGLEELLPLSSGENTEVRRLPPEHRLQWCREGLAFLKSAEIKGSILKTLRRITAAFVRPWICGRKGLATEDEVMERLEKRSLDARHVEPFLRLLREVGSPLTACLSEVDQGVYAADDWQADAFRQIVACAFSYFRGKGQAFLLSHLVSLVEREKALFWQGYSDGFVEKTLRLSSQFRVRKGETGRLAINLAFHGNHSL